MLELTFFRLTYSDMNFPSLRILYTALVFSVVIPAAAQDIPDDLLEDPHVREEFGVNQFTTPSIRKIFEDLKTLRPLPYEELQRTIPKDPPQERSRLALSLGFLLAEGFFAVEAEQFFDLEPVGRALLEHAKLLGAGTKISSHTKSLLEHGAIGDFAGLKGELALTQKDVEKEMVMIRDVDAANLISLGGWLRAFEIGCAASLNPYDAQKASVLQRPDIVEYFALNIETLEQRVQEDEMISRIAEDLIVLKDKVTLPEQETLSEDQVKELRVLVESMVDVAYNSKLLARTDAPAQKREKPEMAPEPKTGGETPTPVADTPAKPRPAKPTEKPATGDVVTGEVQE